MGKGLSPSRLSLVIFVDVDDYRLVNRTLRSLRKQDSNDFELVVIYAEHVDAKRLVAPFVRTTFVESKPGGISSPWEAYLTGVEASRGDFVLWLSPGDELKRWAVRRFLAYESSGFYDLIYSDFLSRTNVSGSGFRLHELPEWAPERLLQDNYLGPFVAHRKTTLQTVLSHSSEEVLKSQYAATLFVGEFRRAVMRIPWALGTTSGSGPAFFSLTPTQQKEAVEQYIRINKPLIEVVPISRDRFRLTRVPDLQTSTSVIIPTMGSSARIRGKQIVLVERAISSLLEKTKHQNLEIVVVYDSITPQLVLQKLRKISKVKLTLVEYKEPFNFSKKCNAGAVHASGSNLVFLNDDVEIITDGFVEKLIAPLKQKDVGEVGISMFYEDGTLQHGGHVYSHGVFMHVGSGASKTEYKRNKWLQISREVSGVTAACAAVRREVYEEVGGFWEHLPGNFNDVDFSLKIRSKGYRILMCPEISMYHFESKTRETRLLPGELEAMHARWGKIIRDSYYT